MTMEMIVVNAMHQVRVVNVAKGEQFTVAKGDTIRLTKKVDINTLRKGNDLVIKNAKGEEFILKDFFVKSANPEEGQLLSWDDPLGQEKEIFSTKYSESTNAAAAEVGDTTNSEAAKDTAEAQPPKEDDDDDGAALLLANSSGEAPIGMLGGIAALGFILLQTGSGGAGGAR